MEILILILAAASFLAGILAVQVFRAVRRGTSKPLDAGTVAWRACKRQQASPDGRTENLDVDDMASAAKALHPTRRLGAGDWSYGATASPGRNTASGRPSPLPMWKSSLTSGTLR